MSSDKKKKRASTKYPALNPRVNSRTKFDKIDYDYLDKLTPDEMDWLNRFSGEYYSGDFKKEEGSVRGDGKYLKSCIHPTDAATRKECYDRNNHNNMDYLSVAKAKGEMLYPTDLIEAVDESTYAELNDFETLMIAVLDDVKKKV
jgi:hypothetical protein